MRIWDVQPGYLNRHSLLGEHRELHAMVSIIGNGKKGYARHPETLRWRGYGWALRQRHRMLAEEMALRGYRDKSPVRLRSWAGLWHARQKVRTTANAQTIVRIFLYREMIDPR